MAAGRALHRKLDTFWRPLLLMNPVAASSRMHASTNGNPVRPAAQRWRYTAVSCSGCEGAAQLLGRPCSLGPSFSAVKRKKSLHSHVIGISSSTTQALDADNQQRPTLPPLLIFSIVSNAEDALHASC